MEKTNSFNYLEYIDRVKKAKVAADNILSKHEQSVSSRVVHLEQLLKKLDVLPMDVNSYFLESVNCLQHNLRRAAVVLVWAGFFHVFSEKLYVNYENEIRSRRAKWHFKDFQEFREICTESSILDVAKEVGYINRASLRVLQGQLSQRNQCAHPSLYTPTLNGAIGYVDEMITRAITL